jgi:hypothetical protein
MALNLSKILYVAIVNGLLNDPKWPVHPKNLIRYDNIEGVQDPEPLTTADADFPQARVEGPFDGKTNLQHGDPTFGTYALGPDGNPVADIPWVEHGSFKYRIIVTSSTQRLTEYSGLTTESIDAVRRLGARLGTPWVTKVAMEWTTREVRNEDTDTKQDETTILLTIETDVDSQQLTGG